jgi:hypothetical protein
MLAQNSKFACLVILPLLTACASSQLNYNTLDLASTTDGLLTRQVLYNFSIFLDSPVAVPAQMVISSGTATTSNSVTPSLNAPLNAGVTTTATLMRAATATTTNTSTLQTGSSTFGLSATDSWNQSWGYAPITDPDRLKRLQALYRYAVQWSDDADGVVRFVANFPLVYKSVSYNKPLCLRDMTNSSKNGLMKDSSSLDLDLAAKPQPTATPSSGQIQVCATAAGTSTQGVSHGATSTTFARQTPDEHYLGGPTCIVCRSPHGHTINPLFRGGWLRWQDLSGGYVRPNRQPQEGDLPLGQAGHYVFYVNPKDAQRFVDFSVAVLSATTVGGSASPSAAGSTSGAQAAGGAKAFFALDPNGNIVQFTLP